MSDARLVAGRYAQALSEVVIEPAAFETARQELRALATLVSESDALRHALANPVIGVSSKERVIAEIAQRMELSPPVRRLLTLLAERERLMLLPELAGAVDQLCDARAGVHEVEIRSAVPLAENTRDRLQVALGKISGGEVRIKETVDPELLGGVVARIGTTVFDGSLQTRLNALRSKMLSGTAGGPSAG